MSKKLQPAALTSTSSVPGATFGSGASPTSRSAGSWKRSTTIARMRILREAGILSRMHAASLSPGRRTLALLASAALAAACATPAPPPPKESGQLVFWQVESPAHPGAHAWLLGSVHLAQPDLVFDPAITAAL